MAIIQDREMQRKSTPMLQPSCKKQHQTFYIKKKKKGTSVKIGTQYKFEVGLNEEKTMIPYSDGFLKGYLTVNSSFYNEPYIPRTRMACMPCIK